MPKSVASWIGVAIACLAVICIAVMIVSTVNAARAAADRSAHMALASEIFKQLAAIPSPQGYPDTLSDLPLTYPDGGDKSLLKRFDYHRTPTGCTVRTTIGGTETVKSFP
jgi:hypothetical protein